MDNEAAVTSTLQSIADNVIEKNIEEEDYESSMVQSTRCVRMEEAIFLGKILYRLYALAYGRIKASYVKGWPSPNDMVIKGLGAT